MRPPAKPCPSSPRQHPKESRSDRQKAWQAIRIARTFTLKELRVTAGIRKVNAEGFCAYLFRAGCLRKDYGPDPVTGARTVRFTLVKDWGPAWPNPALAQEIARQSRERRLAKKRAAVRP